MLLSVISENSTLKSNYIHLFFFSTFDSPILLTQVYLWGHGLAGLALRGFEISFGPVGCPLRAVPEHPVRGQEDQQVLKGSAAAVTYRF